MTLCGEGKEPGRSHLLRLAEQAGAAKAQAAAVIDAVREALEGWKGFAEEAGVSKAGSRRLAAAFQELRP